MLKSNANLMSQASCKTEKVDRKFDSNPSLRSCLFQIRDAILPERDCLLFL